MEYPVACSLGPVNFNDRFQAWRELLAGRVLSRQPTDVGCVLTLTAAPGVGATARELIRLEAECCPWMEAQVTEAGVVTIRLGSSSPGGAEAIRELFGVG
ncbi:MAG: hypothetical protein J2P43_13390 [Candidatus Dormibacteraeota bacterium]|nr:hypothetical protein [Candidatus Dormibacteraeota bacterium]MBO0746009.1 hypothetical protein [Candidatus Dormibacteraeota bacterium]